jgi:DNA-binding LacI/PurR family transcriptional regulator
MSWPHEHHGRDRSEGSFLEGLDGPWENLTEGLFGEIFAAEFAALARQRAEMVRALIPAPVGAGGGTPAETSTPPADPLCHDAALAAFDDTEAGDGAASLQASFGPQAAHDFDGTLTPGSARAAGRGLGRRSPGETAPVRRAADARLPYFPISGRGIPTIGVSLPRVRSRWNGSLGASESTVFPSALAACSGLMERALRGIRLFADEADCRLLLFPNASPDEDVFGTASVSAETRSGDQSGARTATMGADTFLDGSISGLILAAPALDPLPAGLARAGLALVVLAASDAHTPEGCGVVHLDERETAHLALGHLWSLGHRRIACLTLPLVTGGNGQRSAPGNRRLIDPLEIPGPPSAARSFVNTVTQQRLQHYAAWMDQRQAYDPALVGSLGTWDSHEYLQRLLAGWRALPGDRRPTAVFCTQEGMGHAVLAAAHAIGLSVPHDLSIVAVDTEAGAMGYADVPITCVEIPGERMGEEAISLLSEMFRARFLAHREAARHAGGGGAAPPDPSPWMDSSTRAVHATRIIRRASSAAAPSR